MSIRAFARADHCDEALVRRAVKSGALTTDSAGKISADLVGTPWRRANRLSRRGADTAGKSLPRPVPGTLAHAELLRDVSLVKLRHLELQARKARWAERWLVEQVERAHVRAVRAILQPIAGRLAPLVVGKGLREIAAAVRDVVVTGLNAVADRPDPKDARPPKPSADKVASILGGSPTRLQIETAKALVAAAAHTLDAAIAAGEMVDLDENGARWGARCARTRTRMLQLEGVLPPRLVGRTRAEVQQIIAAAVDVALAELDPKPAKPRSRGRG